MDPTLQAIVNIGAAAGALSAIIGLWVGMVKLWPHIKRGVTVMSEVERLPEMAQTLETIRHEMFPNSGASLRDQTNRIEQNLRDHLEKCPPPVTTINVNPAGGGTP